MQRHWRGSPVQKYWGRSRANLIGWDPLKYHWRRSRDTTVAGGGPTPPRWQRLLVQASVGPLGYVQDSPHGFERHRLLLDRQLQLLLHIATTWTGVPDRAEILPGVTCIAIGGGNGLPLEVMGYIELCITRCFSPCRCPCYTITWA